LDDEEKIMKKNILLMMIILVLLAVFPIGSTLAQGEVKRPVITISSYTPFTTPSRGENFSMVILFTNSGEKAAKNLFIQFDSGDLLPRDNGGVQTIMQLIQKETKGISQGFTVSPDLWGVRTASVILNVEYSDYEGNTYTDSFTLIIDLNVPAYSAPAATQTPTPVQVVQPQLVIQSYQTDVDILQPGSSFELTLEIINLGNAPAKSVTMVLGGGTVEMNPEGTPQPGIAGGSGDFEKFAPMNSSNVNFLGDISPGASISTTQDIIVNVTTTPGAYSLKYSFIYSTDDGQRIVENQVITLLIYRMPSIEVGFYQDPGMMFANQPNNLPLQVVNLGKNSVVLGNMTVNADDASLENNSALVGVVEPGFYFTLDTLFIPTVSGEQEIRVKINYTDDFNQPRVYETSLSVEVAEMELPPEGGEFPIDGDTGMPPDDGWLPGEQGTAGDETIWQKVVRFFKGLFGLGSGIKDTEVPYQEPFEHEFNPVP